jgi:dienelactone hydrolase
VKQIRPWPLRALRTLALAFLSLLILLVLALKIDHGRETLLPALTGPYEVSRSLTVWEDSKQVDTFAPSATPRRLITWVWYPVKVVAQSERQPYLPADWQAATEKQRGVLISGFLTRDLSRVRSHSLERSELVSQPARLPVVIMRAGLAAQITQYSSLAEDLASHGYVVVGFDAPYRTSLVVMPDGAVVTRSPANNAEAFAGAEQDEVLLRLQKGWVSDIGFALDELQRLNATRSGSPFAGRLDLERVGVFGHSLGGATVAQFCHDDARCKAGIDLDGALRGSVEREGMPQPFLFLAAEHGETPEDARIEAGIRGACAANDSGKEIIRLREASHFGFSDDGALLKIPGIRAMLHSMGIGGMEGPRQLELTKQFVHSFFDVHLKGAPAPSPNPKGLPPDVVRIRCAG